MLKLIRYFFLMLLLFIGMTIVTVNGRSNFRRQLVTDADKPPAPVANVTDEHLAKSCQQCYITSGIFQAYREKIKVLVDSHNPNSFVITHYGHLLNVHTVTYSQYRTVTSFYVSGAKKWGTRPFLLKDNNTLIELEPPPTLALTEWTLRTRHYDNDVNTTELMKIIPTQREFNRYQNIDYENYEDMAVQRGIEDLNASLVRKPILKRELLCVTFLQADSTAYVNLFANTKILPCDWAVIFYNASDTEMMDAICNSRAFLDLDKNGTTVRSRLIHCQLCKVNQSTIQQVINKFSYVLTERGDLDKTNKDLITKPLMYRDILPYLHLYDRLVIMDSDISFVNFSLPKAFQIWDCAFYPPPLVTSLTIYEYPSHHERSHDRWRYTKYLSVSQGFIELQVPLFDAAFFSWLIRHVLSLTEMYHMIYGTDAGIDGVWCGAAKAYGERVLGWQDYKVPCALLLGDNPVSHLDTQTIGWRKKEHHKLMFIAEGTRVFHLYMAIFPSWMHNDKAPLTEYTTESLNSTCLGNLPKGR